MAGAFPLFVFALPFLSVCALRLAASSSSQTNYSPASSLSSQGFFPVVFAVAGAPPARRYAAAEADDGGGVLNLTPTGLQALYNISQEPEDTGERRPLLFLAFVASWCGHCRTLHAPFEDAAEAYRHRVRALRESRRNARVKFRLRAQQEEAEAERRAAQAEAALLALQTKASVTEVEIQQAERSALHTRQVAAALKRRVAEEEKRLVGEEEDAESVYPDVLFGRFDCSTSRETETICSSIFGIERYPSLLLLRALPNPEEGASLLASPRGGAEARDGAMRSAASPLIAQFPPRAPRTHAALVEFLFKATADAAGRRPMPAAPAAVERERDGNAFFPWLSARLAGEPVRLVSSEDELRLLTSPSASSDLRASTVSFVLCVDGARATLGTAAAAASAAAESPFFEGLHAALDVFTEHARREALDRHFLVATDPRLCLQALDALQLPDAFRTASARKALWGRAGGGDAPAETAAAASPEAFPADATHPALAVVALQPTLYLPGAEDLEPKAPEETRGAAGAGGGKAKTHAGRLSALQVVLEEVWRDQARTRLVKRSGERGEEGLCNYRGQGGQCAAASDAEDPGRKEDFCVSSSLGLLDDVGLMLSPLFTGPFEASADAPRADPRTPASPLAAFLEFFRSPVLPLVSQDNFLTLRGARRRTLVLVALDLEILDWLSHFNSVALAALLNKTLVRLKRGKWREELLPAEDGTRSTEGEAEAANRATGDAPKLEFGEGEEREEGEAGEQEKTRSGIPIPLSIVQRADLILKDEDLSLVDPAAELAETAAAPGTWIPDDPNEMETLLLVEKLWKLVRVASCMYTAEQRRFAAPAADPHAASGREAPRNAFAPGSPALPSFLFGVVDGMLFSDSLEEYGVYTPGDLPAVLAFPPPVAHAREDGGNGGDPESGEFTTYVYRDKARLTLDSLFLGLSLLESGQLTPQVEGAAEDEARPPVFRAGLKVWRRLKVWFRELHRDASQSWPAFIRIVFGFCAFMLLLLFTMVLFISTLCCDGPNDEEQDDDLSSEEEEEVDAELSTDEDGDPERMPTIEEVKRRAERMLRKRR
ncbi:hypothetical protein BESB_002460 [Besnoitia besnoiti]|uniref:Thioredoxin domain-containing protein n=1 Tax=Besnoitia besnoiti TaxID=94643 RepID=A0A2A9MIV1_BESBE|nr:hypothetical protein BESB_002460 [Besnoitia besnoiti]PFH37905.1 hypothetical protein BESB_002460 [Besnoitia besnoiti]